jgi:predicted Zn finger-like uncharacterized protein
MLVHVRCPTCQGMVQVDDKYLGTSVRCPRCGETFTAAAAVADDGPAAPAGPAPLARPEVAFDAEEKLRPLSLERVPWAWVDRVMPARPVPFLLAVLGIAAGCWLVGFVLAPHKAGFLRSHEWQVQPFFLATHFVCLRLYVTCYTRNFLAGAARMDLPEGEAVRRIKHLLGPAGIAVAVAVALPFCFSNYVYLCGDQYLREAAAYGGGGLAAVDLALWLVWCAEWLLNAYIWVLLVGFCALTMWTLWKHRFRAPIEVLLHEKHYRPFLMMSGQGASIVLFFTAVNGFYVWYAQGDIWDYLGLGITGTLLLVGFGPPWMQLKANVERAVDQELFRFQETLVQAMRRQAEAVADGHPVTTAELAERLDQALAVLRAMYLERMHRELGRAEGRALLLKLLAPASTIGWRVLRPLVLPG